MNPLLLSTSVEKQIKEYLGERWQAKCFSYLGNTILITQMKSENDVSELTDECDRFCRYVHRILGAVVTIGIGQACKNILELAQSYSGAREAVSYRVIYGSSRAINMKEIAPQEMSGPDLTNDTELFNLFKKIRMGSVEEIEEAAIMDGATPYVILTQVFFPILGPAVVTTGLLAFISAWNEFLFALTFTLTNQARTVPVSLALFSGASQHELPYGLIMAASVLVTLPLIILVVIFQKRIISGLTAGSVKG